MQLRVRVALLLYHSLTDFSASHVSSTWRRSMTSTPLLYYSIRKVLGISIGITSKVVVVIVKIWSLSSMLTIGALPNE